MFRFFLHPQNPDFLNHCILAKYCQILKTIHQKKAYLSAFRLCINLNFGQIYPCDWFCGPGSIFLNETSSYTQVFQDNDHYFSIVLAYFNTCFCLIVTLFKSFLGPPIENHWFGLSYQCLQFILQRWLTVQYYSYYTAIYQISKGVKYKKKLYIYIFF